ncbi:hypothetical protein BCR44DRAFT_1482746 [Catenaria anguillulae PL171]|uniref:Cilia- and flagella-associated protein 58 central coiled coil domain-containing protein n=1 Tax=Catenaria anguillulae PL171 TaxID=765915 RepID=A0A1Y2HYC2_9FUNG|nr:hypothetical protein BCR44DRAFT_1482746 [Catenaria anguillulae PL171]
MSYRDQQLDSEPATISGRRRYGRSPPVPATADAAALNRPLSSATPPSATQATEASSSAAAATTTAGGLTIPPVPGLEEKQHIESLLAAAESEFRFTIEVLRDDDILAKFRVEHEKLFRSLTRSVLTGVRMFEQYSALHRTFHENVNNAKTLGESTSHDEQTIRSLRGQIKRANEFLESSRVKEEKSKDELRQLRIEVNDLKATVAQGVGLSAAQERNINDLVKMKEEALRDLDTETEKIAHLRSRIVDITDRTRTMDAERRSLEAEVHTLKERDNLETDLREMRQVVSVKIAEVKQKQDAVARALEDIALLQNQVKSQKQMLEKIGRDHESLSIKAAKYRAECDQQVAITNALTEENNASLRDLQKKEAELAKVSDVLSKASKVRDGLQKKIRLLEAKKGDAETTMKLLKDDTNQVLATIDQLRQDVDKSKKTLEDLSRERNILSGNFSKLASDMERDQHALLLLQQTRTNLEQDRMQCERLLERKTRQLEELERDKAAYLAKSTELAEQATALQAIIKQREAEVYAHKKAVVESDTRLKYQQNLYETVQSDRNLHAKNLVDSQNEIAEMKRQLKIMTFTINGLKEEFTAKQEAFAREVADRERLDKEMETINNEIKTLKHQSELAQAYIRTQVTEENKLAQDLKEAETEKQKQEHALALVLSERDRLSAQLIKQDDELLKVYDAIKASQFALLRSQKHYLAKRKQKQALERRVREQAKERRLLDLATQDYDFLKKAVCQLKAELLEEQSHIKVLADEIKNPVNIHRWRKLEGSDPGQLETIQLVHSLQRTLIARAAEDAAKEAEIHEREQTYLQLKEIHSRQVGPEAHEQVAELDTVLADKMAKHKHMQTEVEMYRAQINEYKYKMSGLERQLAELKALYFERKRLDEAEAKKKKQASTSPQHKHKHKHKVVAGAKRVMGDSEFNAVLDACGSKDNYTTRSTAPSFPLCQSKVLFLTSYWNRSRPIATIHLVANGLARALHLLRRWRKCS